MKKRVCTLLLFVISSIGGIAYADPIARTLCKDTYVLAEIQKFKNCVYRRIAAAIKHHCGSNEYSADCSSSAV
jgi:hypothetical protein